MKMRHGGLRQLEQRILDGDVRAARALVRQGAGPNTLDLPFREVQLRAAENGTGGTRLLFTGYASVTEVGYTIRDWLGDYTEIVRGGAFRKTLDEGADVIFAPNHDWNPAPMARTGPGTLRLVEDSTGLAVEADVDGARADVVIMQSAIEAGEWDAMSFAFWVTRQTWSPDYDQRDILEVDMDGGDVSVVTWPANPATTGMSAIAARQARSLAATRTLPLLVERARTEKREGKALSTATLETLQAVLDMVAAADIQLDSAQETLAELMGVPNPDDDTTSSTDATDTESEANSNGPDPDVVRDRLRLKHAAA